MIEPNFNAHGRDNSVFGAFICIAIAETCLVLMGHFIKIASANHGIAAVFFWVQVFSVIFLFPLVIMGGAVRLRSHYIGTHLLRSGVGVAAMLLMFYAYDHLDLSMATLLKLLSPAFIPFVAILVLGERPTVFTFLALVMAFAGVFIALQPQTSGSVHQFGVIAATLAALLAAFGKSLVRRMGHKEPVDIIAFYFSCFAVLVGLALVLRANIAPTQLVLLAQQEWQLLALIALLATLGQYFATLAFTKHRAAVVAIFTYIALPIAALIGVVFWGERVTPSATVSAVLILAAGVLGSRARLNANKGQKEGLS